jgi:hypothetical protein
MQNKKFLIGALVAIALVVGGIAYFGTAGNQQASVGNLLARASTSKPVVKPVFDDNTGAPTSNTAKTGSGKPAVETNSGAKTVAPTPTFPDGCSSSAKYSTTTGEPCLKLSSQTQSYKSTSSSISERNRTIHIVGDGTGGGKCAVYADTTFLGYVKCP